MKSMRSVAALALCSSLALGAVSMGTSVAFAADEMPDKSDQPVTDTWITTKVKTELATTEGVKSTEISVTTKDGVDVACGVSCTSDGRSTMSIVSRPALRATARSMAFSSCRTLPGQR